MKVRIKKSGEIVEVYKSSMRGTWINAKDCTTEYSKKEVEIVNK